MTVNTLSFSPFSRIRLGSVLLAITLSSCSSPPETLKISSGLESSGYQQISQQIVASAQEVGNLNLQDEYDSQGSLQNLERLLKGEIDFALVQLDVASQAMKERQVQAIVLLAKEYIQVITRTDSNLTTLGELKNKRVAVGRSGSGIYFSATRIFASTNLNIDEEQSSLDAAFQKLRDGQVDAVIYVGPLGTNQQVATELSKDDQLQLIAIEPSLTNYLTVQFPESYQTSFIPQGSYYGLPAKPRQSLSTISTATVLITRPDVEHQQVALLTWSILVTARKYAAFYPELAGEDTRTLLQKGLIYIHPGALQALEYGDPRVAWLRYLRQNAPLQAATIMLLTTSIIGFLLRWWRKRRSDKIIANSRQTIGELRLLMEESPQKVLENIEQLRQQHRLTFIDGLMTPEIYEQVERMTRILADQCRTLKQQQKLRSSQHILKLIDDWQVMLQNSPQSGSQKMTHVEKEMRSMLLLNDIDLETYMLLKQIVILSVLSQKDGC